jgi:hypothetical protein
MAHFSRVRVFGLWVVNSTLLPSEMELFDAQLSKAINGDEGGVWAPSSLIEVGGSGIKITGPCVVTSEAQLQGGATVTGGNLAVANDANIQGNATVGGTLEVAGETTITDTLNVAVALMVQDGAAIGGEIVGLAGATITGGDLNVGDDIVCQGNAEIAGTLDVDGNAAIGGTLGVGSTTVTGTLTTTGNASLGGTLAVTGDATLSGTTIAKGRFRRRVLTMGDAGATVSVADYDLIYMPPGVLTADRTLNISTSGALEGDVIRVLCLDTTHFLDVDWGAGGNALRIDAASQRWLELTYVGSAWVMTGLGDRQ